MIKLELDLIPAKAWYTNVRSNVTASVWDKIRKQVIKEGNNECSCCGAKNKKFQAHEIFYFDETKHIQKLEEIICICPGCHETKHFGLAQIRGREKFAFERLKAVNGWNDEEATNYVNTKFVEWERRSAIDWELDLSHLKKYGLPTFTPNEGAKINLKDINDEEKQKPKSAMSIYLKYIKELKNEKKNSN